MQSLSRGILHNYNYKSIFNVKEIVKNTVKYSTLNINLNTTSNSNRLLVQNKNKQSLKRFNSPTTQIYSNYSSNRFMDTDEATSSNNIQVTEIKVPVPWGDVRAQVFGNPMNKHATPILSIHGYLDNSNSFKPLAPYMCENNDYYLISIDLPGHGLSSGLPEGIPYTPKLFLSAVRRVVQYFNLKHFIFLCHSYGIGISFMYDTVFHDEVQAIVGLDWIFSMSSRKWNTVASYWKEGIDNFITGEEELKNQKKEVDDRKPLTRELAKNILMKANNHLDERSAYTLLERALIEKDGKLEFSRDLRVKISMSVRDHYIDFLTIMPDIKASLSAPTLVIHANPASYGQQSLDDTIKLLNEINEKSKAKIELQTYNGTHHFHMIQPKETAARIHAFLDKLKVNPSTKL